MPSLLVLPAEMIENIIDQVSPDDLINFSICCKSLHALAQRRLAKHREQIKTYSKLRYSDCPKVKNGDHPVKLLREICLDAHTAFYPRDLNITSESPVEIDGPDYDYRLSEEELLANNLDTETVQKVFDEFESTIDERLSKTLRFNDKNIDIWRQRLERGTRGAILSLLLLLLPNLEKIQLNGFSLGDEILGDMLDLIAGGSHDPDVSFGPVALTKLSEVLVNGSEEDFRWCQILTPLAALPSVRTITAKSVVDRPGYGPWYSDHGDLTWLYEQHISGVTVLNLQSSCLSAASFSRLLGGIKGLKSFTYDHYRHHECPSDSTQQLFIIDILLEHAKASLESLKFIGPYRCHDDAFCSFIDFEVLQEIRMDSGCYLTEEYSYGQSSDGTFGDWYDDTQRLVNLLPASVRIVEIDGYVDTADMTLLLSELPERKEKSVPHLKSIKFMNCSIRDHEDAHTRVWVDGWQKRL